MTGTGESYGAVTVVNAMPCGIGSTIGVCLKTNAKFTASGIRREVMIENDPGESTHMAKICVSKTYDAICLPEPKGWELTTSSEIPVSRGLKSSSSACNAIISAVLAENGIQMDKMDVIKLGVECARKAGVTVTGSFDDSCGCHIGGLVITDNINDQLILSKDIGEYDVIIHVPEQKIRKYNLPLEKLRTRAEEMMTVIETAKTDPFAAMTMNGRIISEESDLDNSLAELALKHGALGAGISGSGPATAIVTEKGNGRKLMDEMEIENAIITHTRRKTP